MDGKNITIDIDPVPSVPNLTVITLKGSLDLPSSKYVDEMVLPVIEKKESNIILDLRYLEYISSIGIMSLTHYQSLLNNKKRSLKLVKPPEPIYDTFAVFGITKKFDIYDTVPEAVSSFR
jgi:anti-sigma B factor antagonist